MMALRRVLAPRSERGETVQQTMTSISTATAIATLACTNLQQQADFFRNKLGMQVQTFSDMQGYGLVSAGHGTSVMCYERPNMPQCDATALTFVVDDCEKAVSEMRGNGVTFEEYDLQQQGIRTVNGIASMSDGSKTAWFKDPAGNILSVTQLAGSAQRAIQSSMGGGKGGM